MIGLALLYHSHRKRLRLWAKQAALSHPLLFFADLHLGIGTSEDEIKAEALNRFQPDEVAAAEAQLVSVMKREKVTAPDIQESPMTLVEAEEVMENVLRLIHFIRFKRPIYYRHIKLAISSEAAESLLAPLDNPERISVL